MKGRRKTWSRWVSHFDSWVVPCRKADPGVEDSKGTEPSARTGEGEGALLEGTRRLQVGLEIIHMERSIPVRWEPEQMSAGHLEPRFLGVAETET